MMGLNKGNGFVPAEIRYQFVKEIGRDYLIGINNCEVLILGRMIPKGMIEVPRLETPPVESSDNSRSLEIGLMKTIDRCLISFISTVIQNKDMKIGIGLFEAR